MRAIAALGDAAIPSQEAIAAIVAHLADPAEVVREEALIASLRNADAVRPALLSRMAADSLDVPTSAADSAAAALKVIDQAGQNPRRFRILSIKPPLLGLSRWKDLFEPKNYLPDAVPAEKGPAVVLLADTAARAAALPRAAIGIRQPENCQACDFADRDTAAQRLMP